ncbi:MAG: Glycine/sarcosine/betaine reductase complex component A1 [Syntrophorhabdus sp. PtaU1.Bin002]|nr:MAG: Glycine/sarcosine/betaine reductase complex component A1 [Syntrophorhabdus sp. PtaB.Bin006]OPY68777.1 MAG: Glycine/sarcosine/betaine reductase complex component A1 [Syntrophorhabdus sp. PtaU1.Bin002]
MDTEKQAIIKQLVDDMGTEGLVVVIGAADPEVAQVTAETVTFGDPSFAGPLAGVSLRLPVYHILEPEVKKVIPQDVYKEQAGFLELVANTEEIGKIFREIRGKARET